MADETNDFQNDPAYQALVEHYNQTGLGGGLAGSSETRAMSDFQKLKELEAKGSGGRSAFDDARLNSLKENATPAVKPAIDVPNAPMSMPGDPGNLPNAPLAMPGDPGTPAVKPAAAPSPAVPPSSAANLQNAFSSLDSANQKELQATQNIGDIQSKKAALESNTLNNFIKQQELAEKQRQADEKDRQDRAQTQLSKLNDVIDSYQSAPDVDPKRMWNNMNMPQKISAGIAVALGAFGGGVSGKGGNVGLDMINKAIEKDLDAQKMALEKKKSGATMQDSLLGQMRNVFGDERSSYAAAQAVATNMVKLKLEQIAANSTSQEVKEKTKVLLAGLERQGIQSRVNLIKEGLSLQQTAQGTPLTEDQIKAGFAAQDASAANKSYEEAANENQNKFGTLYDKTIGKVPILRVGSRAEQDDSQERFIKAINGGKLPEDKEVDRLKKLYYPTSEDDDQGKIKKAALRLQEMRKLQALSAKKLSSIPAPDKVDINPKTGRTVILKD